MQMVTGDFSGGSTPSGSDSKAEETLVSTTFTWKHGGREVFVTGSFNQWLGKIPMRKADNKNNEFSLMLDIPAGKHQYKFIVDDKWFSFCFLKLVEIFAKQKRSGDLHRIKIQKSMEKEESITSYIYNLQPRRQKQLHSWTKIKKIHLCTIRISLLQMNIL